MFFQYKLSTFSVLYNVFNNFVTAGVDSIDAFNILKGILSFFVIAFGGVLIGVVCGVLAALTTTFVHCKILKNIFFDLQFYRKFENHLSDICVCHIIYGISYRRTVAFVKHFVVSYCSN
jgi:hypothetical protein